MLCADGCIRDWRIVVHIRVHAKRSGIDNDLVFFNQFRSNLLVAELTPLFIA